MAKASPKKTDAPEPTNEAADTLRAQLSDRQRLFAEFYVGAARFNATKAAEMAGYSDPNADGSRIRHHPIVSALIEARLAEVAMGANEILTRLSDQAELRVDDFYDVDTTGYPSLNLKKAAERGRMHLIQGFSYDKHGRLNVEFHNVQSALTLLGKNRKLFVERVEHSGNIDYSTASDEELELIRSGKRPGTGGSRA